MNLQEFAALKVGDAIHNDMTHSHGEVTSVDAKGVRVRWGDVKNPDSGQALTWHYSVQSTAWFHWSKVEPISAGLDQAITDELNNPPKSIMT